MMQSAIPTGETISGCRRLICAAAAFWLLVFGFAQIGLAQTPLSLFKNYFVTGDYVVAGWVEGSPDGSGYASGTINVPDLNQPSQNGVPATVPNGADIVATYLYWATVEGSQSSFAGQQAYFNGYSITGTVLGNPNAPTSWSLGGCSGSAQGSKTMRTYRADVRPYLPLDTNSSSPTFGALLANGSFPVRLADSGSIGNTAPNALGATLVIIYRVLSPPVPLNAIVLYDGAFAPNNTSQSISQTMTGFYQPATNPVAKLTHIVANGQPNKFQQVYLNSQSQPLPSLYGTLPPFPGIYGSWDNPTWVLSQYGYVSTTDTSETTSVVPSPSNSGCVSWGTIILSTTVQDTDGDGLLNVWENSQGYTDASSKQWVALPGASATVKDIFVEVDYLNNLNGSAGSYLHSHLPKQDALDAVGNAFATQNINVHFDLGPGIYQSDPYVVSYPVQIPNPLPPGTSPPQAGTGGERDFRRPVAVRRWDHAMCIPRSADDWLERRPPICQGQCDHAQHQPSRTSGELPAGSGTKLPLRAFWPRFGNTQVILEHVWLCAGGPFSSPAIFDSEFREYRNSNSPVPYGSPQAWRLS